MEEKDRRLAELCRRGGFDGVWLRRRANIAWASDGADVHVLASSELGVASLLWTPRRKLVLTDAIEAPRLRAEEFGEGWEIAARPWWEPATAPAGRFAVDWPDDCLTELRAPLTDLEVARARELAADSAEEVHALMLTVLPGWSELDVAADLGARLLRRGIRAPVVLIAADERIAGFRHPVPTERRFERTLMTVLCAERRGLIVCLTRLVHFGRLPPDLAARHAAVVAVDEALHRATRPGERWGDALEAGRRAYAERGFPDEWQLHHQGGPMGYQARDFLVTPAEERRVVERQLVGWNPSIRGTKSEDTVLTGPAGVEVLTGMRDWPMLGSRPDILRRGPSAG